jgi:hypothetical protein
METNQNAPSPFIVILDESGYYDGSLDDELKHVLRSLKGIENASYVVNGDNIFVFEKLVSLAKLHLENHPDTNPRDFAPNMVSAATMPIHEAVKDWMIMPVGFRVEPKGDCFQIWHTEFKARLPQEFTTMEEVNDALVSVLKGELIPGEGTFAYKGQNLIFTHSMDPEYLPEKPQLLRRCKRTKHAVTTLGDTAFVSGFSPVSKEQFKRIQAAEKLWAIDMESMRSDALRNIAKVWKKVQNISWTACDTVDYKIPDFGEEDLIELRRLYPGFQKLSDKALYNHFDIFQYSCRFARSWQAYFDPGFLFYMLGELSGWYSGGDVQERFGEFAGHAILSGLEIEEAFDWAERAEAYHTSVRKLAWRTDSAMRFLKNEAQSTPARGPKISTTTDFYRQSRSLNAAPISFVQ